MATFRVTGPDGSTYRIEAPDEQAAMSAISDMFGSSSGQTPAGASGGPETGMGKALGRGALQGATFGFADELQGAAAASPIPGGRAGGFNPVDVIAGGARLGLEALAPSLFGKKGTEAASKELQGQRDANKANQEAHPYATIAGNILGGVALPLGGANTAMQGAKLGAATGALYGVGSGEGLMDRLGQGAVGAAIGAPLGAAGGYIAGRIQGTAPAQPSPQPAAQAATQKGIRLSAGQATGDMDLLTWENAAAGGGYGGRAQNTAQSFIRAQSDDIAQATQREAEAAGRGLPLMDRSADAGQIVRDGLRQKAAQAKQSAGAKFDDVFSSPGDFAPEALTGIKDRITQGLLNRTEPVIPDDVLTPAASRALSELDNIAGLNLGKIGQPGAGQTVLGVNMRGVEQARRRLLAFARSARDNADKRAVSAIIEEFDGQIDDALSRGLFSGSDDVLKKMRNARSTWSKYRSTFSPQGKYDDVGRAIERFIKQDVTPEEVANYLYGTAKIGAKGQSVRIVNRLKSVLGENSDEINALRQGLVLRIVNPQAEGQTQKGAQMISERIFGFTNGDGRSLAQSLFTQKEIGELNKLAAALKATVPPREATNPPNSGNRVMQTVQKTAPWIAGIVGGATGGPAGAVIGWAAGEGGRIAREVAANQRAVSQFAGQIPRMPFGERLAQKIGQVNAKVPQLTGPFSERVPLLIQGVRPGYSDGQPKREEQKPAR